MYVYIYIYTHMYSQFITNIVYITVICSTYYVITTRAATTITVDSSMINAKNADLPYYTRTHFITALLCNAK